MFTDTNFILILNVVGEGNWQANQAPGMFMIKKFIVQKYFMYSGHF